MIYVLNSKSEAVASNAIWQIDISDDNPTWQPLLPALDLRFDPIEAFAHNNCIFVLGHQTALQNFVYKYDPVKMTWTCLLQGFSGDFVPKAGILLHRQMVKKAFFDGSTLIQK